MFGFGTGELLLLLVIALLVLGPERMPKLARDLGKAMNDLRRTSDELRTEFLNADRTLNAEKLLDVASRVSSPPETGKAAEVGATMGEPAPIERTAPPEPEETVFDREVRLARERIDRGG